MSNILILTSTYLPFPGANGINTHAVINELKKKHHKITVLSTKSNDTENDFEIIDGIEIYRISQSNFTKKNIELENSEKDITKHLKLKILFLIRKVEILLKWNKFPNFDKEQNIKTLKLAEEIIERKKIKSLISIYKPYTNIYTLIKIKKKHPNIKCGVYFLDLLDSMTRPKIMTKKYFNKKIDNENLKILSETDYILVPLSSKKYYQKLIFNEYIEKIDFTDFPTLKKSNVTTVKSNIELNNISFTYAGTLNLKYRNPNYFLNTFFELNKMMDNISINILGKNNCESMINDYSKVLSLKNYGFLSQDKVEQVNENSNFLINISNSIENAVPSKIFELFSTGKPIINFVHKENDSSVRYFNLYPASFNFFYWKDFNSQLDDMYDFIQNNKDTRIEPSIIENIFFMNLPEYTVKKIEKRICQEPK